MLAGYARVDITPELPVPLAGHVTLKERLAARVLDPLQAYALVFRDDHGCAAVITLDLLLVDKDLLADVTAAAATLGIDHVHLMATHTHSGFGGFQVRDVGSLFLGHPRPAVRMALLESLTGLLKEALAGASQVSRMTWGSAEVPGLTMNRRVKEGLRDDWVQFVRFDLEQGAPILLLSTSGHPVVVSCKQIEAMSADYPGRLRKTLAERGVRPIFLTGAVGACNILFPEMECSIETHFDLLQSLILGGLSRAQEATTTLPGSDLKLQFQYAPAAVRRQRPPRLPLFARQGLLSAFWAAVGNRFANSLGASEQQIPVPVLAVGPLLITGMPADYSVFNTMRLREKLRSMGYFSIVTSQTNGYIGYMHPVEEYKHTLQHKKEFFHYENAMTWYGPEVADCLEEAAAAAAAAWSATKR